MAVCDDAGTAQVSKLKAVVWLLVKVCAVQTASALPGFRSRQQMAAATRNARERAAPEVKPVKAVPAVMKPA